MATTSSPMPSAMIPDIAGSNRCWYETMMA